LSLHHSSIRPVEGDFWPLNTTLYVRDFKGHAPRFVEALLKTVDFDQYSDKAAVPGINRNDLHTEKVAIPPPSIEGEYAKSVESLFNRHSLNVRESNSLSDLREVGVQGPMLGFMTWAV
jgi:type I restriction enzyme, S subunit